MKKSIFILTIISLLFTSCLCMNKDFSVPPHISILKDNNSLVGQDIIPSFYYLNDFEEKEVLHYTTVDTATYVLNQWSELMNITFEPKEIYISYDKLLETDTLEVLLDYHCSENKCSCEGIELKYIKYKGEYIEDRVIRK